MVFLTLKLIRSSRSERFSDSACTLSQLRQLHLTRTQLFRLFAISFTLLSEEFSQLCAATLLGLVSVSPRLSDDFSICQLILSPSEHQILAAATFPSSVLFSMDFRRICGDFSCLVPVFCEPAARRLYPAQC